MRKNFVLVVILFAASWAGASRVLAEPMAALADQHRAESEELLKGWLNAPVDLAIPQMEVIFAIRNGGESQRLLDAQQDPSSPQYHKWLTPEAFVDKFAPTQDEVDAIARWLLQEGFQ